MFVSNTFKCFGIPRLSVSEVEAIAESMEGKFLVITWTLTLNNQDIRPHALINCGARRIEFIEEDFTCHCPIQLHYLKEKKEVDVIDGKSIKSGDITPFTTVAMVIQHHKVQLPMCLNKSEHVPIVPRMRSIGLHDVAVHAALHIVMFGSQYCTIHSVSNGAR